MPITVIYIVSAMLFFGVIPLPYGFYTLLRIIVTGIFIWAAFITYEKKEGVLPWIFGFGAILFNPLVKIHLPKELWAVIDISSGIFLLVVKSKIQNIHSQRT